MGMAAILVKWPGLFGFREEDNSSFFTKYGHGGAFYIKGICLENVYVQSWFKIYCLLLSYKQIIIPWKWPKFTKKSCVCENSDGLFCVGKQVGVMKILWESFHGSVQWLPIVSLGCRGIWKRISFRRQVSRNGPVGYLSRISHQGTEVVGHAFMRC